MKRKLGIQIGLRLFIASLMVMTGSFVFAGMALVFPGFGYTPGILATGLTDTEEKAQGVLLDKVRAEVKKIMDEAGKENISKAELDKRIDALNKEVAKLNEDSLKALKTSVDDLAKNNVELQKELKETTEALKAQSEEIKKIKDIGGGINKDEVRKSFREALKDAIMEQGGKILKEKNDDYGKRFSMKDYFDAGNRTTPQMTVKVAVDMLESSIVQANVSTIRLTELDPMRVGIPLTIYPHVMDVFKVKTINRPIMALLVVYSYEDGAATKVEGAASSKSSFLFKTVSFPAFFIATYFTLSDETLDDLDEALDEISIVAPSKILDKIDTYVLGSAGDDVTAIAGILTATKNTAFSNYLGKVINDAYIVDVIATAKLQAENNKYKPNVVYMSPEDILLLGAKKNTFDDSQSDRRVVYNTIGEPVSVCGLRIITSTEIDRNTLIVLDNNLPWIGRRKDMTMEIGHNGTDLTEGQKTVVIKIRLAFGVRDKAGVIYVSDITAAIASLETS